MRLSTLPRISATRRSGRAARSWAARRGLPLPTTAPAGSAASVEPSRETRASRTSARSLTAATASPSVEPEGISFKLCTATSISPSRRARSSSTTKTPRPPISASESCERSPLVVTLRRWKRTPGWARRRASRTSSVCRRARRLPRLPTTNSRRATTSAPAPVAAADLEQVLQRLHVEAGVGAVLEAGDWPVQHLLDDGAGHRFDALALLVGESGQAAQGALHLTTAKLFGPLLEGGDYRKGVQGAPPGQEVVRFVLNVGLLPQELASAAAQAGAGDGFDVVDVEQADAWQFTDG